MSKSFLAGLIYFAYLLGPGYLLSCFIGIPRHRFVVSYGISISLIIITFFLGYFLQFNFVQWLIALHIGILVACGGGLIWRLRQIQLMPCLSLEVEWRSEKLLAGLFLLGFFSIYHLWVGPYTEIPSDFWKQLARVNTEFFELTWASGAGHGGSARLHDLPNPIYFLHAAVAKALDATPLELVTPSTWAIGSIFLLAFYSFSLLVLEDFSLAPHVQILTALLSVALTIFLFGTTTFSFIRYYGYFPTIFAFPLVFGVVAVFIDHLRKGSFEKEHLFFILISFAAMLSVHIQEAYFTIILLTLIAIVRKIRSFISPRAFTQSGRRVARITGLIAALLIAAVSLFLTATHEIKPWKNTPHVIDIGKFFGIFKDFPMDNPSFRLWDTVGTSGIIILFWAIFQWKEICRSDFFLVGIISPFVTNLNPLFALVFLHIGNANTLWRTAYLIPIGLLAAILIATGFVGTSGVKQLRRVTVNSFFTLLLFISMIPWSIGTHYNRTSRVASLLTSNDTSGHKLWFDLIQAVGQIQKERHVRRIITDDVTRFVLYAATRGEIYSWLDRDYFPKNNGTYQDDFLHSDYSHSLLVINRRSGILTPSARHARHWSPTILQVSESYPPGIEHFISSHPNLFELLWTSSDIQIYLMQRQQTH
jgi:hypothetical protein